MAPYYIAVIFLNILVSALLYFAFGQKFFSRRSIAVITAVSLLTGLLFPSLAGHLNIYIVLIIGLTAVGLSSYYLVKTDPRQQQEVSVKSPVVEPADENAVEPEEIPAQDEREGEPVVQPQEGNQESSAEILLEEPVVNHLAKSVEKASKKRKKKDKKRKNKVKQTQPNPEQQQTAASREIEETEVPEAEVPEVEVLEVEVPEVEVAETEVSEVEVAETEVSEVEVAEAEEPEVEVNLMEEQVEDRSVNQLSGDSEDLRESYIMRGFDAKGTGEYPLAVKYFESAIELNPPADLAEMIQFDIYTMLRELGLYTKARETMDNFIDQYRPELSISSINELKSQIKYIEILQDMLNKANSPNLPYSRIPVLIKMSAEEKFNVWKSESLY